MEPNVAILIVWSTSEDTKIFFIEVAESEAEFLLLAHNNFIGISDMSKEKQKACFTIEFSTCNHYPEIKDHARLSGVDEKWIERFSNSEFKGNKFDIKPDYIIHSGIYY